VLFRDEQHRVLLVQTSYKVDVASSLSYELE